MAFCPRTTVTRLALVIQPSRPLASFRAVINRTPGIEPDTTRTTHESCSPSCAPWNAFITQVHFQSISVFEDDRVRAPPPLSHSFHGQVDQQVCRPHRQDATCSTCPSPPPNLIASVRMLYRTLFSFFCTLRGCKWLGCAVAFHDTCCSAMMMMMMMRFGGNLRCRTYVRSAVCRGERRREKKYDSCSEGGSQSHMVLCTRAAALILGVKKPPSPIIKYYGIPLRRIQRCTELSGYK